MQPRFRLETVLRLRGLLAEQSRQELAVLEREKAQIEQHIRDSLQCQASAVASVTALLSAGSVDSAEAHHRFRALEATRRAPQQGRALLAALETTMNRKREEVVRLKRAQESLQTLKSRWEQAQRAEAARKEAKLLDEAIILRSIPRRDAR